jgi:hypothetical protein
MIVLWHRKRLRATRFQTMAMAVTFNRQCFISGRCRTSA